MSSVEFLCKFTALAVMVMLVSMVFAGPAMDGGDPGTPEAGDEVRDTSGIDMEISSDIRATRSVQGLEMDMDLGESDASFLGEDSIDYSGKSVAGAGDVNGDG